MKNEAKAPATLVDAVEFFSDEDRALQFFVALRWPSGVCCPHCGSTRVTFLANQRRWKCNEKHARAQFSAKVGTIFEDSPLSLSKWMVAVWLETNAKNSISSYEVHRALGITQKSAWFMQHRIRLALQSKSLVKMSGPVEADETFFGGKARNMHKKKRERVIKGSGMVGKTAVMGILKRGGEVRTAVVRDTMGNTVQGEIRKHVEPGAAVYTDAWRGYRGLTNDFVHDFVDHTVEYVKGAVHTNGLENFWSLLKRAIKGTHVSVEPIHLHAYVDAEVFRYNNRKNNDGGRFLLAMRGTEGKRLTYAALTGATEFHLADHDNAEGSEGLPN